MDNKKIVEVFDSLAPLLADMVGGPVHLIRVTGPRWSYVAGHVPGELPFVEPQKVVLFDDWALLYYPEAGRKIDPDNIRRFFLDGEGPNHDA